MELDLAQLHLKLHIVLKERIDTRLCYPGLEKISSNETVNATTMHFFSLFASQYQKWRPVALP